MKTTNTLSQAQRTPGPWKTGDAIPEDNTVPIISEWSAKGSRVIAYVTPKPFFDDTQQANARLIAAAPDLLAALEELMLNFVGDRNSQNCSGNSGIAADQARAAIARAKGQA